MGSAIEPYSSATEMLAALRRSDVSSVELIEMHIARIESADGELNAIPVRTLERAREAARRADEARAAGRDAALLGLPITLKESTQVAGCRSPRGLNRSGTTNRPATDRRRDECSPQVRVCSGRRTFPWPSATGRRTARSTGAPTIRGIGNARRVAAPEEARLRLLPA